MGLLIICATKSTALCRCEDLNHGALGQTISALVVLEIASPSATRDS